MLETPLSAGEGRGRSGGGAGEGDVSALSLRANLSPVLFMSLGSNSPQPITHRRTRPFLNDAGRTPELCSSSLLSVSPPTLPL